MFGFDHFAVAEHTVHRLGLLRVPFFMATATGIIDAAYHRHRRHPIAVVHDCLFFFLEPTGSVVPLGEGPLLAVREDLSAEGDIVGMVIGLR